MSSRLSSRRIPEDPLKFPHQKSYHRVLQNTDLMGTTEDIHTTCVFCGCGCGLVLHVNDGQILKASPEVHHPFFIRHFLYDSSYVALQYCLDSGLYIKSKGLQVKFLLFQHFFSLLNLSRKIPCMQFVVKSTLRLLLRQSQHIEQSQQVLPR